MESRTWSAPGKIMLRPAQFARIVPGENLLLAPVGPCQAPQARFPFDPCVAAALRRSAPRSRAPRRHPLRPAPPRPPWPCRGASSGDASPLGSDIRASALRNRPCGRHSPNETDPPCRGRPESLFPDCCRMYRNSVAVSRYLYRYGSSIRIADTITEERRFEADAVAIRFAAPLRYRIRACAIRVPNFR